MIVPSSLQLWLWFLLTVIGLAAALFGTIDSLWPVLAGLLVGVSVVDGLLSLRRPLLTLERSVHHSLPVTAWSKVNLKLTNGERRQLTLQVHDRCDADFQVQHQPIALTLGPGRSATFEYRLLPTRRGPYSWQGADIFVDSPLHLWQKKWFLDCVDQVKIFPNFREINRYVLLAIHHQLSMMGIKKLNRRGEGNEFHQLREYRRGDELQKIDWKATSRYRRLISKDYQDERDQQVVFVLDCGWRMSHMEMGKSHLDQALNSILLLAYVAARQGDGVGFYAFGGAEKWLPPKKREDSVKSLLLALYDIESSIEASDYLRATQHLLTLQNRRGLVVVITSSRAEDHDDLLRMAQQLRSKHLVVIADLRESLLDESLQAPISTFSDALRYQALRHYLAERKKLTGQLQHLGVKALDVTPEKLPAAIVNTYLEIKGIGRL